MIATTDSIESLAFFLQQAPGVGAAGLRNIFRKLAHEEFEPRNLLSLEDWKLQAKLDLKPESIAALRSPADQACETWQNLERNGVAVLVRGFEGYPKRLNDVLGDSAPPIIYVAGNRELLDKPSAGFCGSRLASAQGIEIARQTARLLARESINVVSGYAKGVDIATHSGALEEVGGTTTIILAEGILHFRLKQKELPWLGDDPMSRIVVVSEFPPRLPWKAHNAMTRNRTICALSEALVVIESGMEGGTFDAGNAALNLSIPLFCVKYAQPLESASGNVYFLEHGAIPLQRSPDGQPNTTKLVATIKARATHQKPQSNPQHEFAF
jgi:predicted Rossmann fold nucleotide-binding protein DprA/Smf involved in DNA uptake